MISGFLYNFYFWMLKAFFSVKSCQNFDMHSHMSLFYRNIGLVNASCLSRVQCWHLQQRVSVTEKRAAKLRALKSSHLFHAETGIYTPPVF